MAGLEPQGVTEVPACQTLVTVGWASVISPESGLTYHGGRIPKNTEGNRIW